MTKCDREECINKHAANPFGCKNPDCNVDKYLCPRCRYTFVRREGQVCPNCLVITCSSCRRGANYVHMNYNNEWVCEKCFTQDAITDKNYQICYSCNDYKIVGDDGICKECLESKKHCRACGYRFVPKTKKTNFCEICNDLIVNKMCTKCYSPTEEIDSFGRCKNCSSNDK